MITSYYESSVNITAGNLVGLLVKQVTMHVSLMIIERHCLWSACCYIATVCAKMVCATLQEFTVTCNVSGKRW